MSDTQQGPGWWLASDGRWYPPEAWTGAPPSGAPTYGMPTYGAPAYGTPGFAGPGYPANSYVAPPSTNGLAVASLVCACAGVVPFFFGLTCVLGIIFGFVARSQIRKTGGVQQGAGLALAGIIVGFSLIALAVIGIVVLAAVGHTCIDTNGTNCAVN